MLNDFLTKLEHAGGAGILSSGASFKEREALALHLGALRAQGHAILADEVMNDGESTGEIRVIHYLTCSHNSCRVK